jgi:hypothetical protein
MGLLVECEGCGQSYARVLLAPAPSPVCRCGRALSLEGEVPQFVDRETVVREENRVSELARAAERLAFLIVATDCPRIDVEIERASLRRRCQVLFPDKMDLYEMVYESRFARLWQQFRAG